MSLIKLIEFLHVNLESVIHQYVHKIVHIFNNIWIIVRRVVYTCMRKRLHSLNTRNDVHIACATDICTAELMAIWIFGRF